MCHDLDSHPPIAPIAGAAVDHRDLVLSGSGGDRFAAFAALSGERDAAPAGSDTAEGTAVRAGVVILPDVRGLHPFYEELALRFAEERIDAVAFDYFGRTAGVGRRDESFEYMPHVQSTTWAGIRADVQACVEWLRAERGVSAVFTVGFCFGGRHSFLCGTAADLGLAGVIGFYGNPEGTSRNDSPPPVSLAARYTCPVLGLFGGQDPGIPAENIQRFDAALTDAGVAHELVTYPDAPHSFFDRKFADHIDDSADAWRRVLAFVRGNATRS